MAVSNELTNRIDHLLSLATAEIENSEDPDYRIPVQVKFYTTWLI